MSGEPVRRGPSREQIREAFAAMDAGIERRREAEARERAVERIAAETRKPA